MIEEQTDSNLENKLRGWCELLLRIIEIQETEERLSKSFNLPEKAKLLIRQVTKLGYLSDFEGQLGMYRSQLTISLVEESLKKKSKKKEATDTNNVLSVQLIEDYLKGYTLHGKPPASSMVSGFYFVPQENGNGMTSSYYCK